MVPMSSSDPVAFDPAQRRQLLTLARQSIAHGLDQGGPLPVVPAEYPRAQGATGGLRDPTAWGACAGASATWRPSNPWCWTWRRTPSPPPSAIPGFPLTRPELARLTIEISVLTPPQPLACTSEEALLRLLEPGRDGLILEDGAARGTFLPTVWESLPDPRDFLRHLKQKAGLPPDHWSERVRVERYRTESFSE